MHSGGTLRALGDTFGVPEDTVGVFQEHFGHSHGHIGGVWVTIDAFGVQNANMV